MTSRRNNAIEIAKRQDKIALSGIRPVRRELLRAAKYSAAKYEFSGRAVLPDDFKRRLSWAMGEVHRRAMADAITITQRQLKSAAPTIERKFDWPEMAKRFAFEFAASYIGAKIASIESTLIGTITTAIKYGMLEGEGHDKIARRIKSIAPRATLTQAARIARTEVHGASGFASMKVAGLVGDSSLLEQEWLTTQDGREREAHREADGQRQPLGQPFIVGGERLMFPGDPNGSPENVINCRCVSATVLRG